MDLNWFSAADLAGKPVPARGWLVRDMIPDRTVTLLGGDGGTGKSQIALQLSVATEIGSEWLGQLPEQGPVVFASAEDDQDELHRRLSDIAALHNVSWRTSPTCTLPRSPAAMLSWACRTSGYHPRNCGLARPCGEGRTGQATSRRHRHAGRHLRGQRERARRGSAVHRTVARARDNALCAVLLLNHPSLSGMASGAGTSGSTAWSNSVRSRIYFERAKGEDGIEIDPDLRLLKVMKANDGPVGMELRLRWTKGVFRLDGQSVGSFDKLAADAKAEHVFLDLLAEFDRQGRDVSPKKSPSFAPSAFAKNPDAGGVTKKAFEAAMERLLKAKRIAIKLTGPMSRRYSKLVIAEPVEDNS